MHWTYLALLINYHRIFSALLLCMTRSNDTIHHLLLVFFEQPKGTRQRWPGRIAHHISLSIATKTLASTIAANLDSTYRWDLVMNGNNNNGSTKRSALRIGIFAIFVCDPMVGSNHWRESFLPSHNIIILRYYVRTVVSIFCRRHICRCEFWNRLENQREDPGVATQHATDQPRWQQESLVGLYYVPDLFQIARAGNIDPGKKHNIVGTEDVHFYFDSDGVT